jgi:TM2 domain-containing membrane protein YozV
MAKRRLNWIVTLVLSIVFGWLGVDRFMMGQVGWGILKLVTFGGVFIWWLVDWILIASKYQFKDVEWVE